MTIIRNTSLFLLFATALVFTACGGSNENTGDGKLDPELKAEHNEVVRIHDEVMPKTGLLHAYANKIRETFPDSVKAEVRSRHQRVVRQLEEANHAMDSWMRDYVLPKANDQKEATKKYLQEQKGKISEVRDRMEQALNEARALMPLSPEEEKELLKGKSNTHEAHQHEGHKGEEQHHAH